MITSALLTRETLTVVFDGNTNKMVRKGQANWEEALAAYTAQDESRLRTAMDAKAVMQNYSNGDLTIDGTGVLYHGKPLHGVDVDRILAFQRDGLPYQPIANYINRCRKNTSQRAIQELYPWLEHRQITLTPDGKFIGYKGVKDNFYSVMGNTETIVLQGQVDAEGHILNEIGKVIEVNRSCVSDDFRNGCGPGLHVGALAYAVGWGQRVILVEVDPADVVSIPTDCSCQKLRCCKYRVVGEYVGPLPDTLTTEFSEGICPQCGCDDEDCKCNNEEAEDGEDLALEDFQSVLEGVGPDRLASAMSNLSDESWLREKAKIEDESLLSVGGLVSELEQVAQDAGILPKDSNDDVEDAYLQGMKDGIDDREKGISSKYLSGDERGADSPQHSAYIEGYVDGYI